jgi:hypothetical protein
LWVKYTKDGAIVTNLSQEEVDKWSSLCPDWYKLVTDDLNSKGLPGTKYVSQYLKYARGYIGGTWKPDWDNYFKTGVMR